jgi:hypothetical protein
VSRRLLELHALLGGGADIDVIWMVTREPTLLTASKHQLISRLMAMKVGCSSSSSSSSSSTEKVCGQVSGNVAAAL